MSKYKGFEANIQKKALSKNNCQNNCLKEYSMVFALESQTTYVPANDFIMYCHQIKIGDLFVLNTYKGKLCIKMIRFSREIDCHHKDKATVVPFHAITLQ